MIYNISFKNFYSFKEKFNISFVVDKNSPDSNSYFRDKFENKLTKMVSVVGANASGKTNIFKAFCFIPWFMTSSFNSQDDLIDFKKFTFTRDNLPTELSMEFGNDEKIFKYIVILTPNYVISEELYLKDVRRFKKVFTRKLIDNKYEYSFRKDDDILNSLNIETLRDNCSFISWAKQYNYGLSKDIFDICHDFFINVSEDGVNPDFVRALSSIRYYSENPEIKNRALKLLNSKFDINIDNVIIEKTNQNGTQSFNLFSEHKVNGDNYKIPFQYESSGSQNLFYLLKNIILALDSGGVAIIDEIDNNLHPLLVKEIVNIFKSSLYNPKNAQIIFSTHSSSIINELDKQQILFVEKNDKEQKSSCYFLKDISGVRVDENFYQKYLSGKYGAIPEPKI